MFRAPFSPSVDAWRGTSLEAEEEAMVVWGREF